MTHCILLKILSNELQPCCYLMKERFLYLCNKELQNSFSLLALRMPSCVYGNVNKLLFIFSAVLIYGQTQNIRWYNTSTHTNTLPTFCSYSCLDLTQSTEFNCSEVVLTAWPPGQHFYLWEPVVLTCKVESNSSEVWIYNWFRHNLSEASTPSRAHRVSGPTYSISALTSEDSGMYWCRAQKQDTNFTLLSNSVSLNVMAGKTGKLSMYHWYT